MLDSQSKKGEPALRKSPAEPTGSTANQHRKKANRTNDNHAPPRKYSVVRYMAGRREVVSSSFRDIDDATRKALSFMHDPDRKQRELFVVVEHALGAKVPYGMPPHGATRLKKRNVHVKRHLAGFVVSKVCPPVHIVVTESMATFEEAWEAARLFDRVNPHPEILYFVERRGVAIPVTDMPFVEATAQYYDDDVEKYPWEVEDWHGDLSLKSRQENELGLGIPAQWGKGRRSRKGEYIP